MPDVTMLKLIYSEKATKFEEISCMVLTLLSKLQNQVGDFFKFCGLLRKSQQ